MNKVVIGVLFLFVFFLFLHPIETEDVWWHLSVGRWIFQTGAVPQFDPFPFSGEQIAWTGHNQWLGSLWQYLIYKVGGLGGLKIYRALFFVLVFGLFFVYACRKTSLLFAGFLVLLMSLSLAARFSLRPELFNLIFVQIFLMLLIRYYTKGDWKILLALPFVGALWFNVHIGAFMYGLPLTVLFWLTAIAQNNTKFIRHLTFTILGLLAAFFLTPYGVEGFLYPFKVLFIPEFINFYQISSNIGENSPPAYLFMSLQHIHVFLLVALALAALVFQKNNKILFILLFSVGLLAFLISSRNIGIFIILSGFVIVSGFEYFNGQWSGAFKKVAAACLIFVAAIKIFDIWNVKYFVDGQAKRYVYIEESKAGREVIDMLKENGIRGKVFNIDSMGGKLLWLGYPDIRPFIDGRYANKISYQNYNAVLSMPSRNWPLADGYYHFDIAILNALCQEHKELISFLHSDPSWLMVALKSEIVVFVKKDRFNLPEKLKTFENDLSSIALDQRLMNEISNVLSKPVPAVGASNDYEASRIMSLWRLGYRGAAVTQLLDTLSVNDQADLRVIGNFFLSEWKKA
jgi:hypothetical protein